MGAIVFFAVILFVMGGVTAYMGDRLGSYIGKKRHSSFGLRPRHTAMLWTVVSGGVIAVGTLLLFLSLNNTFKTALVRGPQLLESNRRLAGRNRVLLQKNASAARSAAEAGVQAEKAHQTLVAAVQQIETTQKTLTRSRTVLAQRQAALASAQQKLAEAQHSLGSTHADLYAAQAQVHAARSRVLEAKRQAQAAGSQVIRANKTVLALGIQQDRLHADNAKLTSQNQAQESLLQASQGHALIFRREEELGRTVISARQTGAALRRELSVFLDRIELSAREKGAGGPEGTPAVVIPALGEADADARAGREAALDALSQNIAAQGGFMPSIVVVADARYNTFRGEPVKLDLRPYANILVFPRGAMIAHGSVDGRQPEDAILKELQNFLIGQVRTTALQRGIIPIYDPESGASLVGQPIGSAVWIDLVKQIQQAGPNAKITATAGTDTYSADLLHLDFHVAGS